MFTVHKIALFTNFYPPHVNNEARFTYFLANELVRLGIEVCIFTTGDNKEIKQKELDGITVVYLPSIYIFDNFTFPRYGSYKKICEELTAFAPDAVIVNDYNRRLSFLGAKAASMLSIHAILINHQTGHTFIKNKIIAKHFNMYEHRMMKRLRKRPIAFAGISEKQNEWLNHFAINAHNVVTDAVDIEYIPAPGMRRKLKIAHDAILYVMSADIMHSNMEYVLKAFESTNAWSGPDIILVVYGAIDKKKKIVQQNVIFTGLIPREDILSLLDTADVYITRNCKNQGLSIDLLEAGTYACATLCINEVERHLVIDDEEHGFLVEEDAIGKLASKIQRLRVHKDIRTNMAQKLKNKVDLRYNWNQSALALIDIICEMKDSRRRR